MKKIKSILIGILLIISILTVINPVSAATLEVGPSKTYSTIGDAITAAGPGDTILVYPGTYNENVLINKSNLTLKSVGGRDVTIIGPGTGLNFNSVIFINGSLGLITVDGFTVLCSDTVPSSYLPSGIIYGFSQSLGTTCYILNNKIIATGAIFKNAIQVKGENSKVIGNIIQGKTMGYPEWGSTGILSIGTKNLLVKDNNIYGTDNGIAITEDTRNGNPPVYDTIIENNIVENCSRKGIYLRGNVDNTLIIYNTIINNPNWGLLEQHYLNYFNTGDPCNTKVYYNKFCNNGIDIESTNAEHHPNCKHCTLDARGNRGCTGELPITKILNMLQKNFQKAHGGGGNASVYDS